MITTDYNKACAALPSFLHSSKEYHALQQINIRGNWFYRAIVGMKCRACRHQNRRLGFIASSTPNVGGHCTICGNPFCFVELKGKKFNRCVRDH